MSHTKYNCLYHIAFIPKYKKKAIYRNLRRDISIILWRLCEYKRVEIIETNACIDHIYMLMKISSKIRLSQFIGYLKRKSTLLISKNHVNLKYKYGQRIGWTRGYYVSTIGLNNQIIKKYIKEQETEDIILDKKASKNTKTLKGVARV